MIDFQKEINRLLEQSNLTIRDISHLKTKNSYACEAYFSAINYTHGFSEQIVLPVSRSIIKPTDKDKSLINLYQQIYFIAKTVIHLNDIIYFHNVIASTRMIFELHMDLQLLIDDLIENGVIKYVNFPDLQKYRAAKKLVNFYKQYKSLEHDISLYEKYISENEIELLNIAKEQWGLDKYNKPKIPDHWSGFDGRKRAEIIDKHYSNNVFEDLYLKMYMQYSWHIHSDPTALANLDSELLENRFSEAFVYFQQIYLDTILSFGKHYSLHKSYNNFFKAIENIKQSPGYFMLEKEIRGASSKPDFKESENK
jgi:hypothetical protein